jgi:hypothetical protein
MLATHRASFQIGICIKKSKVLHIQTRSNIPSSTCYWGVKKTCILSFAFWYHSCVTLLPFEKNSIWFYATISLWGHPTPSTSKLNSSIFNYLYINFTNYGSDYSSVVLWNFSFIHAFPSIMLIFYCDISNPCARKILPPHL